MLKSLLSLAIATALTGCATSGGESQSTRLLGKWEGNITCYTLMPDHEDKFYLKLQAGILPYTAEGIMVVHEMTPKGEYAGSAVFSVVLVDNALMNGVKLEMLKKLRDYGSGWYIHDQANTDESWRGKFLDQNTVYLKGCGGSTRMKRIPDDTKIMVPPQRQDALD